jgi:leucyl-tRNA---protein transferase
LTIERRNFPQFFITAPAKCPYLPGRLERKVFTHLIGPDAKHLNSHLSHGGFRRSQNIAYRPACDGCGSCVSVRVLTAEFTPSRGQRRILKHNRDLRRGIVKTKAGMEHFSLFRRYIDARHGEGGMADMTALDFSAMVDDSFVESRLVEYRRFDEDGGNGLIASCLVDVLEDGLSMIYSFYDQSEAERSLGTYMILDHIEQARRLGLPYLYLGYWVKGSRKMDYKAAFLPQERLSPEGWQPVRV